MEGITKHLTDPSFLLAAAVVAAGVIILDGKATRACAASSTCNTGGANNGPKWTGLANLL